MRRSGEQPLRSRLAASAATRFIALKRQIAPLRYPRWHVLRAGGFRATVTRSTNSDSFSSS